MENDMRYSLLVGTNDTGFTVEGPFATELLAAQRAVEIDEATNVVPIVRDTGLTNEYKDKVWGVHGSKGDAGTTLNMVGPFKSWNEARKGTFDFNPTWILRSRKDS